MVVPSFSKIVNRGLDPKPAFKEPSWGPEQQGVSTIPGLVSYFLFAIR